MEIPHYVRNDNDNATDYHYSMNTNILPDETIYNRPCCVMLREQAKSQRSLVDPAVCTELLSCVANNCVLMKEVGSSRVKIDQQYGQCYLLVDPTAAREILNEVTETITLEGLTDCYEILNQIESRLAKNPLRDEIIDNHAFLLATIRKGETKFGAVPQTVEKGVTPSPELSDTQKFFLDQPRLADKPQFDGMPPTQTPITNDNPSAAEQVARLQEQHQPKPAFNPRPTM